MKIIDDIANDISKYIGRENIGYEKIMYSEIKSKENRKCKYERLNCTKNKIGIYFFLRNGKVLYIGQSSSRIKYYSKWTMYERIKQHFSHSNTGSILYKLPLENLIEDNDTKLVVIPLFDTEENSKELRRTVLFLESFLIGKYKPKYNFYVKEG